MAQGVMDPLIDPIFVYPEEWTPIYNETMRATGILPGAVRLGLSTAGLKPWRMPCGQPRWAHDDRYCGRECPWWPGHEDD